MVGLNFILPEIIVSLGAMALLMFGVFTKNCQTKCNMVFKIFALAILVLLAAAFYTKCNLGSLEGKNFSLFNGMFIFDELAAYAKFLTIIATVFVIIICTNSISYSGDNKKVFEFPVLMLLAVAGMFVLVSASDLISMYLGIELMSLSLYVLTAINRDDEKSSEAAIKYFVLGALSSCIILYGASLIYGFSGSTNLTEVAAFLSNLTTNSQAIPTAILVGMVFVISGICFKLSLAPFHMWAPDVYDGATKGVVAFLATAPKVTAFVFFARIMNNYFAPIFPSLQQILIIVSIVSMVIGAFAAVKQTNIKRLLAYSGVANMGYLIIGLATNSQNGLQASLVYLTIYVVTSLGVFAIISILNDGEKEFDKLSDLAGLAKTNPFIAFSLASLVLSLAGIPPLAGFFGKFFVFMAALENGLFVLSIIGVVTSVVGAFYYLKIIKIMYFDEKQPDAATSVINPNYNWALKLTIFASVAFNLLLLLKTGLLLKVASAAASSLF
jgi:NADH-quinone oxidoreductase subunit N